MTKLVVIGCVSDTAIMSIPTNWSNEEIHENVLAMTKVFLKARSKNEKTFVAALDSNEIQPEAVTAVIAVANEIKDRLEERSIPPTDLPYTVFHLLGTDIDLCSRYTQAFSKELTENEKDYLKKIGLSFLIDMYNSALQYYG